MVCGQEYKDAYHTIGLFRKEMCNLVTEVSPKAPPMLDSVQESSYLQGRGVPWMLLVRGRHHKCGGKRRHAMCTAGVTSAGWR